MPKRLLQRCRHDDCIAEFRIAAGQRFDEGLSLAIAGRRTGAIYLWGYCAEMTVKAAYFAFLGMGEFDAITPQQHLRPAIAEGRRLNIIWPRSSEGHQVRAWAELLVIKRSQHASTMLPSPLDVDLQRCTKRLEQLWEVILRYRRNHAYLHEVSQVRESVAWILAHSAEL